MATRVRTSRCGFFGSNQATCGRFEGRDRSTRRHRAVATARRWSMKHMVFLTDELLAGVIQNIPERTFDSHRVIREVMRRHPRLYVQQLAVFLAARDPIKRTHQEIGKRLVRLSCLTKLS